LWWDRTPVSAGRDTQRGRTCYSLNRDHSSRSDRRKQRGPLLSQCRAAVARRPPRAAVGRRLSARPHNLSPLEHRLSARPHILSRCCWASVVSAAAQYVPSRPHNMSPRERRLSARPYILALCVAFGRRLSARPHILSPGPRSLGVASRGRAFCLFPSGRTCVNLSVNGSEPDTTIYRGIVCLTLC
jgi:hypothetical protein